MVPLMSLEVELFLWADRLCPREALHAVYTQLKRSLPHVAGTSGMAGSEPGIFLCGGERIYPDTTQGCAHLEIAYALFAEARHLIAAYCAGFDRIAQAARGVEDSHNVHMKLFGSNCCYEPLGVKFGLHENYTYRGEFKTFVHNMPSLQVALSQPCGAGGFENRHVSLRYVDAPRKLHINRLQGTSTGPGRLALVDGYNSHPHGRYQRRQLLTANQVHPRFAHQLWLRMAITRAFVWLCEQNLHIDDKDRLADPLVALHAASDPCWNPKVSMATGSELTLWEFQRSIVRFLEDRLEQLPKEFNDETARACRLWERMLDALENDSGKANELLSWCGQLSMLKQYAECEGFDWREIQLADRLLSDLQTAELSSGSRIIVSSQRHYVNPALLKQKCKLHGADPNRVREAIELLPRLQYLSTKWHEVGENIFTDKSASTVAEMNLAPRDIQTAKQGYVGTVTRELERCELLRRHVGRSDACAGWDNVFAGGYTFNWPDPWSSVM